MNQFTTETIINSFYDKNGKPLFEVKNNTFIAKKLFSFKKNLIKAIYKTEAKAAAEEVFELDLTNVISNQHSYVLDGATKLSDVYRLHIKMKTVDANISEFQNSLTRNNKEYNFEIKFSANSNGGNNDSMAEAIEKAINMQNRESKNRKFDVSLNGDVVTLTAIDGFTRFAVVELQAMEENLTGYNAYVTVESGKLVTKGESGFGTALWLMRNFRIPTYVNTNWLSLRQDDRPIPGVLYNQYTFHVEADRGELTGMGAVGQKMTSKTTHVLYVAQTAVSDFEDLLNDPNNGLQIDYIDYDCNNLGDESAGTDITDAVKTMKAKPSQKDRTSVPTATEVH